MTFSPSQVCFSRTLPKPEAGAAHVRASRGVHVPVVMDY